MFGLSRKWIARQRISAALSRSSRGFTLIEMMIVVAIVAILAAIAYPNYTKYGFRSRRAEGREMIMRTAAAQERYYTNFNKYAAAMDVTGLAFTAPTTCTGAIVGDSDSCYYNVAISNLGPNNATYTLTATPKGLQAGDSCGPLQLTSTGVKSAPSDTGTNGTCW